MWEGVVVEGAAAVGGGGSSGSGSSRVSACGVGAIWLLLLACFAKVAGVFLERLHRAFQLQRG